jgi:hypothetical protein
MRAVGSVFPFPLAEIGGDVEDSLWARWTAGFEHHAVFQTARGALRALLQQEGATRLWLPAYICAETLTAAPEGCEILFYQDGPALPFGGLTPRAGDAVLGVDYFGRNASAALRTLAHERRDALWIEDRAQAMAPETPPWGDVVLYSPRKLIGLADGSLMVSNQPLPPSPPARTDPAAWTAALARLDDPEGEHPTLWSLPSKAREAAFTADPHGMQPLASQVLKRVALDPLSNRRKANYACLLGCLEAYALWPEAPAFAPLAFPVRVQDAALAVGRMAEQRVFCPRHWAQLPSPAADFPIAHALSATLLSIPCDHRYDEADMERVASALQACADPLQPR